MLCKKDDCCGCSACLAACPMNCISMRRDEQGFQVPIIDERVCIQCNACLKVCPNIAEKRYVKDEGVKAYAAICREKDGEIRRQSSSGGLFWCLAQVVLKKGGIIVGAKMSEDGTCVFHSVVDNENDLVKLMGSKYVQSNKIDIFRSVRDYLQGGRVVLFSGTPCEVAGLVNYLPSVLLKGLYTVDLICHGVPSPLVWEKYLSEQNMAVQGVSFRDKTFGWKNFSLLIQNKEECLHQKVNDNLYMRGFLEHLYLRESCHNCRYKGLKHISDITLGDFWRVKDFLPEYDDDQGTSMLFIYSKRGHELFETVKTTFMIDFCEVDPWLAAKSNPMMLQSSKPHKNRNKFFKKIKKKTVAKAVEMYTRRNLIKRVGARIKKLFTKLKRR